MHPTPPKKKQQKKTKKKQTQQHQQKNQKKTNNTKTTTKLGGYFIVAWVPLVKINDVNRKTLVPKAPATPLFDLYCPSQGLPTF